MGKTKVYQPHVLVLLATHNGADFLDEQLDSLAHQTLPSIDVLASDDGSRDATRKRLATWAARWDKGRFDIVDGPRAGFAENFRSLLIRAPDGADFLAFSDQDDIWSPDKLEAATHSLAGDPDTPRLYGSRTRIVDRMGRPLGMAPLFSKPPDFRNALVQSIAGGNTMVWNPPAQRLLAEASRRAGGFVSHDWWAYMIVSGAGGEVRYDPEPRIAYRQHAANQIGSNDGWEARLLRLRLLARGRLREWFDVNLAALEACADLLAPSTRETVAHFTRARTASLPMRPIHLVRSGVYRQTRLGHLGLYLACVMRWL